MLCYKYGNDAKYMRTHKRLKVSPPPIGADSVIFDVLMGVKAAVDQKVFSQEIMPSIIQSCRKSGVKPTLDQVKLIDQCISTEYFAERNYTA